MKRYDRRYFEHWYRSSAARIGGRARLARKVRLAVSAAEYVLNRPIATVLDVGCGEAPWRAELRRLRPAVGYTGVDSSPYVVRRFGRARNIRLGHAGALEEARLEGPYDLVVCADVLHYLPTADVRLALASMHFLAGGLAFIEAFTSADAIEGDHAGFQRRTPVAYRRLFAGAGFVPVGLHLYVPRIVARGLVALERGVRA